MAQMRASHGPFLSPSGQTGKNDCQIRQAEKQVSFERQKLIRGLFAATVKRDVPATTLAELIDDIESELRDGGVTEISSIDLGSMVLKRLVKIDKVAYIRFASVYREFKDVDEFSEELRSLENE